MACSSGCPTQDHATYGACMRAKGVQVADVAAHQYNTQQKRDLDHYVTARKAGMQPATTFRRDVDKAIKITEATGVPYRADKD